jgi:hypothetical protein
MMAKRAAAAILGTPLPADWRQDGMWRVAPMLARIPEADYDETARSFEAAHRGVARDDWKVEWRAWCRAVLLRPKAPASLWD